MNSILVDLIAQAEVAVYMDDILIYSRDLEPIARLYTRC
jgi:hypothetical protein